MKEKVFQLALDTSVSKRPSDANTAGYKETSFDSIKTVGHLFITGDDRTSINRASQIDASRGQESSVIESLKDDSHIENELQKVNKNLNTFTLEQF